jgi:hypothetical protein
MERNYTHLFLGCIPCDLLHNSSKRTLRQLITWHLGRTVPAMDILSRNRRNELERNIKLVIPRDMLSSGDTVPSVCHGWAAYRISQQGREEHGHCSQSQAKACLRLVLELVEGLAR